MFSLEEAVYMTKVLIAVVIFCSGVTLGQNYNPINIEVAAMQKYYEKLNEQILEMELQIAQCASGVEYVSHIE